MSEALYREALPHLEGDRPFIADGGLETTLIFHRGIDLPCFAAFDLLKDQAGRDELRAYFEPYLAIARERGVGLVLDTVTWRANPDWGQELGYALDELDEANRRAVALAEELRETALDISVVINGVVGPRGDGYVAGDRMSAGEAQRYHGRQIQVFAGTAADMVTAITMTYPDEAIGVVRAAREVGLPVAISFTVETDGRLPNGQALREAIDLVDAQTDGAPAYFMINCAHPSHFAGVLDGERWLKRIGGVRANASTKSHAELDEADELDEGDPVALGAEHLALRPRLPSVRVLGGCCGTDHRHVAELCAAWTG